jgi:hypothetical protein
LNSGNKPGGGFRTGADRHLAGLLGLGNFAHELNMQQAVFQARPGDRDMIGKAEATLELARGDAPEQELALGLLGPLLLGTADHEPVFLGFDRKIGLGKARNGQADAIAFLGDFLDVVRGVALVPGLAILKLLISENRRSKPTVER